MTLYIDGQQTEKPELSDKERELLAMLSSEWFGDGDVTGFVTTSPDPDAEIESLGLQIAGQIEWANRDELGALLDSLESKKIIDRDQASDPEHWGNERTEIWFDVDAIKEMLA